MQDRQLVLQRDVQQSCQLAWRERVPDTALDAGIVGVDQHLAATDHAQASDHVGTRDLAVVVLAGSQRRELKKGRTGI